MRVYTHFTLSEREYLEAKLKEGKSFRQIAKALGRSPSQHKHEVSVLSYTHFTLEERKYLQQVFVKLRKPWDAVPPPSAGR